MADVLIQCGHCKQEWADGHACSASEPEKVLPHNVIEGVVCVGQDEGVRVENGPRDFRWYDVIYPLIGHRVRVTVEVLD